MNVQKNKERTTNSVSSETFEELSRLRVRDGGLSD